MSSTSASSRLLRERGARCEGRVLIEHDRGRRGAMDGRGGEGAVGRAGPGWRQATGRAGRGLRRLRHGDPGLERLGGGARRPVLEDGACRERRAPGRTRPGGDGPGTRDLLREASVERVGRVHPPIAVAIERHEWAGARSHDDGRGPVGHLADDTGRARLGHRRAWRNPAMDRISVRSGDGFEDLDLLLRPGAHHHARAHGVAGRLVDEDEAAGRPAVAVLVEHQRLLGPQAHPADLVEPQLGGLLSVERVDVDGVAQLIDQRQHRLGRVLQEVAPTRPERRVRHPADRRLELGGHGGLVVGSREHDAARDVDLVRELDDHRHRAAPPSPARHRGC